MTSYSFGAFIDVESSTNGEVHKTPSAPAKALPRVYHSVPNPIELESIQVSIFEPIILCYSQNRSFVDVLSAVVTRRKLQRYVLEALAPGSTVRAPC